MAPYIPEEVNVFSVPHSRMKELVNSYFALIQRTNFSNIVDMSLMLESLYKTFTEFRTHEQIENKLIMKKLQAKMQQLAKQNSAVCNCHKGSKLTEMMHLVKDGFNKSTVQDCVNYGIQLTKELEEFTRSFLPHMQEEEEVFQPLLLEYFTYDELRQLKQAVIHQHLVKNKFYEQDVDNFILFENEKDSIGAKRDETFAIAMQDRCRCAQVCQAWNVYVKDKRFWTNVLPVQWAQGLWSSNVTDHDDVTRPAVFEEKENRICKALCLYWLPSVGPFVRKLVFKGSTVVNDSMLRVMLQLCCKLEHLDLSNCSISDDGLQSLSSRSLTTLVLSGCVNITDTSLVRSFARSSKVNSFNVDTHRIKPGKNKQEDFLSCFDSCGDCIAKQTIRRYCAQDDFSTGCSRRGDSVSKRCFNELDDFWWCRSCCGDGDCNVGMLNCCGNEKDVLKTSMQLKRVSISLNCDNNDCKKQQRATSCNEYNESLCHPLQYLDLSGCWQLTDTSLIALSENVRFLGLRHVDLSGCFQLTAAGLGAFVGACKALEPSSLYYCDNIIDGPFASAASGCLNLECPLRVCCRTGD